MLRISEVSGNTVRMTHGLGLPCALSGRLTASPAQQSSLGLQVLRRLVADLDWLIVGFRGHLRRFKLYERGQIAAL